MSDMITISLLLREEWRTPEGVARVKAIADRLDIHPSTSGRATISARMPVESFSTLFRVSTTAVAPRAPGESDFGSPGGRVTATELEVPAPLKEYVEVVSLVPPAARLR